jgi:hypothetical protein
MQPPIASLALCAYSAPSVISARSSGPRPNRLILENQMHFRNVATNRRMVDKPLFESSASTSSATPAWSHDHVRASAAAARRLHGPPSSIPATTQSIKSSKTRRPSVPLLPPSTARVRVAEAFFDIGFPMWPSILLRFWTRTPRARRFSSPTPNHAPQIPRFHSV